MLTNAFHSFGNWTSTFCRTSLSFQTLLFYFPLGSTLSVSYCLHFHFFFKFYLLQLTWQLLFAPLTYSYFFSTGPLPRERNSASAAGYDWGWLSCEWGWIVRRESRQKPAFVELLTLRRNPYNHLQEIQL